MKLVNFEVTIAEIYSWFPRELVVDLLGSS